jgi:hypothetical protein
MVRGLEAEGQISRLGYGGIRRKHKKFQKLAFDTRLELYKGRSVASD